MAFDDAGLIVMVNGGAIGTGEGSRKKIYHYATNDADTAVEADGYFDTTDMNLGDLVIAALDVDGTPEVKIYVVDAGTGDASSNDVSLSAMLIS